jgi:ribosomal-protein-alanine N-acetyltransferase
MHDIYSFGIQLHHSNTLIGSAALSSIDTYSKLAKISYQIGKQHWGNGYATEAVQALLTFGFRRLKLRRIECSVFTDNARSIRVLKNLGFRREGWRQQSRRSIADGKLRDEYMYALLRTQWKQS